MENRNKYPASVEVVEHNPFNYPQVNSDSLVKNRKYEQYFYSFLVALNYYLNKTQGKNISVLFDCVANCFYIKSIKVNTKHYCRDQVINVFFDKLQKFTSILLCVIPEVVVKIKTKTSYNTIVDVIRYSRSSFENDFATIIIKYSYIEDYVKYDLNSEIVFQFEPSRNLDTINLDYGLNVCQHSSVTECTNIINTLSSEIYSIDFIKNPNTEEAEKIITNKFCKNGLTNSAQILLDPCKNYIQFYCNSFYTPFGEVINYKIYGETDVKASMFLLYKGIFIPLSKELVKLDSLYASLRHMCMRNFTYSITYTSGTHCDFINNSQEAFIFIPRAHFIKEFDFVPHLTTGYPILKNTQENKNKIQECLVQIIDNKFSPDRYIYPWDDIYIEKNKDNVMAEYFAKKANNSENKIKCINYIIECCNDSCALLPKCIETPTTVETLNSLMNKDRNCPLTIVDNLYIRLKDFPEFSLENFAATLLPYTEVKNEAVLIKDIERHLSVKKTANPHNNYISFALLFNITRLIEVFSSDARKKVIFINSLNKVISLQRANKNKTCLFYLTKKYSTKSIKKEVMALTAKGFGVIEP